MASHADKSKPYFPLAGGANDGYSNEDEATATCFCGAVQLAFSTKPPGLIGSFVCNCSDCHKITASMFASNFIVADDAVRYTRGQDNVTEYGQSKTIAAGNKMTNTFCTTCGTLLYRVGEGFPAMKIMRIGTVDDFNLMETVLRPRVEQFVENRVSWLHPTKGLPQVEGMSDGGLIS